MPVFLSHSRKFFDQFAGRRTCPSFSVTVGSFSTSLPGGGLNRLSQSQLFPRPPGGEMDPPEQRPRTEGSRDARGGRQEESPRISADLNMNNDREQAVGRSLVFQGNAKSYRVVGRETVTTGTRYAACFHISQSFDSILCQMNPFHLMSLCLRSVRILYSCL